jgi:membrane fusion protein, heavy metal efflux system
MAGRFTLSFLAVMTTLGALLAASAAAHEGHDHGAPPPPVSASIAPRADASTTELELVTVARGGQLWIYLDSFRDNKPVNGASIEIDGPGGPITADAAGDGIYVAKAPFLAQPGTFDLAMTVLAGDIFDVLTTSLVVPEKENTKLAKTDPSGFPISSAWAQNLGAQLQRQPVVIGLAGAGGVVVGLVLAMMFRRRSTTAVVAAAAGLLTLSGAPGAEAAGPAPSSALERDIAQRFPDGSIFVPKATQRILAIRTLFTENAVHPGTLELPARVIPDPSASGYVQASVSGRLSPPPGGFPQLGTRVSVGDVLALVQPSIGAADVTSQLQQARELDQMIMLAERKLERFKRIESTIARAEIEDTTLELQGLRARRLSLERSPSAPEKLIAPVSGVVAAAQAVAGQMAEPNTIIFQIIDPTRYWVEALSFEAHSIDGSAQGRFMDGASATLLYRGTGLADRNQAIPVHFSIETPPDGVRAGQLLTVLAKTADQRAGIAVPRTSVLRGANGQSLVYEHTNAERFVPREVRTEPLDGERVIIVSGVEPGKRIVTQGTELLNQIR